MPNSSSATEPKTTKLDELINAFNQNNSEAADASSILRHLKPFHDNEIKKIRDNSTIYHDLLIDQFASLHSNDNTTVCSAAIASFYNPETANNAEISSKITAENQQKASLLRQTLDEFKESQQSQIIFPIDLGNDRFSLLVIKKTETENFQVIYCDPIGIDVPYAALKLDPVDQETAVKYSSMPQEVRKIVSENLNISEQNVIFTQNRIQKTSFDYSQENIRYFDKFEDNGPIIVDLIKRFSNQEFAIDKIAFSEDFKGDFIKAKNDSIIPYFEENSDTIIAQLRNSQAQDLKQYQTKTLTLIQDFLGEEISNQTAENNPKFVRSNTNQSSGTSVSAILGKLLPLSLLTFASGATEANDQNSDKNLVNLQSASSQINIEANPPRPATFPPSAAPSFRPTARPTTKPTTPTSQPTTQPTRQPSLQPSNQPSNQPSTEPTTQPNSNPTSQPSSQPTSQPSSPEFPSNNLSTHDYWLIMMLSAAGIGSLAEISTRLLTQHGSLHKYFHELIRDGNNGSNEAPKCLAGIITSTVVASTLIGFGIAYSQSLENEKAAEGATGAWIGAVSAFAFFAAISATSIAISCCNKNKPNSICCSPAAQRAEGEISLGVIYPDKSRV